MEEILYNLEFEDADINQPFEIQQHIEFEEVAVFDTYESGQTFEFEELFIGVSPQLIRKAG